MIEFVGRCETDPAGAITDWPDRDFDDRADTDDVDAAADFGRPPLNVRATITASSNARTSSTPVFFGSRRADSIALAYQEIVT